ncbi:PREDICTED: uncharacterized protein LOC18613773 [Theobroma cacao]|uniref:Uncharacterized protein LOC18613773 n=1 Tax=Theobroma cacao TaxID=3641 RepID=A0AB32VRK4_THECC|nr:PREDICTED: uncharacterized protein LOC18613773 [Theobroma cacao]
MEISVEKINVKDANYFYDAYNVHVEDHRILTIVTYCEVTAGKWIKDSKKAYNSKSLPNTVIVGLSVERHLDDYSRYGLRDTPYQLLHLCIGSHCLIYHLPDRYDYRDAPVKFLNSFLSDPKVVVVGMEIKEKASKLKRDFGVKIKNVVDLNELALKGMNRDELDLGRYDLDKLAKAVLGKHVDVVRPEKKIEWFATGKWCHYYSDELSQEKVLFTTVDAYLCFWIGSELFDMIHGNDSSAAGSSKKNKKKKNKKK